MREICPKLTIKTPEKSCQKKLSKSISQSSESSESISLKSSFMKISQACCALCLLAIVTVKKNKYTDNKFLQNLIEKKVTTNILLKS